VQFKAANKTVSFNIFSKVRPNSCIVNLATRNQLVSKQLNVFLKNRTTAVINIDADNVNKTELKNLTTLMVEKKLTDSVMLADFNELQNDNFQNKSEKISLVADKIKNGFLILFLSGVSFNRYENRFLTKTIILTGKNIILLLRSHDPIT
jgi:hypothetical protein